MEWRSRACSVVLGLTVRASDRGIWRVEDFDMKRRPVCLPVLLRSYNWLEWNMKRWKMKGKIRNFSSVRNISRSLLTSTRIILKNYEYSLINTEWNFGPHPGIMFERKLGTVGWWIYLSDRTAHWKRVAYRHFEEWLNCIFSIFHFF